MEFLTILREYTYLAGLKSLVLSIAENVASY